MPINDNTNPDSGIPGILQTMVDNANLAYPVIAECSLEIATTEPLFSDDFIALGNLRSKASAGSGGITTVLTQPTNSSNNIQQQTQQNPQDQQQITGGDTGTTNPNTTLG